MSAAAAPRLIELRDPKVRRGGVEVLDVPSLRLHEHELVVSLISPNGSGNSTPLLMMGLLERSSGDLLYRGPPVGSRRAMIEHRRRSALVAIRASAAPRQDPARAANVRSRRQRALAGVSPSHPNAQAQGSS